jgi:hypothetical protein
MKALLTLAPILTLFFVGFVIVLHSGGERGGRARSLADNLGALLFRLVGYLAGLAVVQKAIGSPSVFDW